MKESEEKVTLNVTSYQAGKIYQLLMEKGDNFKKANIPSVAKKYYELAKYIYKKIDE